MNNTPRNAKTNRPTTRRTGEPMDIPVTGLLGDDVGLFFVGEGMNPVAGFQATDDLW